MVVQDGHDCHQDELDQDTVLWTYADTWTYDIKSAMMNKMSFKILMIKFLYINLDTIYSKPYSAKKNKYIPMKKNDFKEIKIFYFQSFNFILNISYKLYIFWNKNYVLHI